MQKQTIAAFVAATIALTAPVAASADTKDLLIGGAIGALIHKGISDNQRAKQQRQTTTRHRTTRRTAPSLNSQYTRAERIQIQSAFRDLGYSIGAVDGVLGRNSRAVIRQFQASQGEAQTGQLTRPQYISLLSQAPGVNPVYARRELNRDEVMMLQQGLQTLGYYPGYIDGSKGPGTLGALSTFLAQNGTSVAHVTPVQSLVMARNAAGLPTPPYLQREAGVQITPVQPFATQQAGFGPSGQQPVNQFAAPNVQQPVHGYVGQGQQVANPYAAQQPAPAFGATGQQPIATGQGQLITAPAQQQFGAPQQQPVATTNMFNAAPQPQAVPQQQQGGTVPAGTFAPTAPQPQQQAPQPTLPQGNGQNGTLYAGGAAAPAQPQVTQSSLDIFSGTASGQAVSQPNQVAGQSQPAVAGTVLD